MNYLLLFGVCVFSSACGALLMVALLVVRTQATGATSRLEGTPGPEGGALWQQVQSPPPPAH